MNRIIAKTIDGRKVGMVSDEINTILQAKIKFENDLNIEIDIESIFIEKMNYVEIKNWAVQHTNTMEFNKKTFKEKLDFMSAYGI